MKQQLENIEKMALAALDEAKESAELENLRVRFLGKKGELTALLKKMGSLSPEERPVMGQKANQVRAAIAVGKINVDEQPELASQFGVMSIPTLMVFKDGKAVNTSVGVVPKAKILEML